ncbi:MAG TPA: hypothetical protein VL635_00965 [Trinickia sp.]|nr:hypothetical protein [Trinickia sp.]
MISRSAFLLSGALVLALLPAAHAETTALGGASPLSVKPPAEAAGPNQLFPPLPSLASLPPSAAEQLEEPAAASPGRRHGKKAHRPAPHKVAETSVRMVVSDASQAYLTDVEHKLDDALRAAPRDSRASAGAVSVAQAR